MNISTPSFSPRISGRNRKPIKSREPVKGITFQTDAINIISCILQKNGSYCSGRAIELRGVLYRHLHFFARRGEDGREFFDVSVGIKTKYKQKALVSMEVGETGEVRDFMIHSSSAKNKSRTNLMMITEDGKLESASLYTMEQRIDLMQQTLEDLGTIVQTTSRRKTGTI